jgi:hypothetical protein
MTPRGIAVIAFSAWLITLTPIAVATAAPGVTEIREALEGPESLERGASSSTGKR